MTTTMTTEYSRVIREQYRDSAECLWCGCVVDWDPPADTSDPRQVGDWNDDGDFGCGESPDTGEDGTGGHVTRDDVRAMLHDLGGK